MMHPSVLSFSACVMLATPALAQVASIRVTHDDPDGLVEPGQVVCIATELTWSPQSHVAFGATGGSVLATPALGQTQGLTSAYGPGLTTLGAPVPGGVEGFRAIGLVPLWVPIVPAPYSVFGPTVLLAFDWIAPSTPGTYEFAYHPSAEYPLVELFPSTQSQASVPVASEYVGTNLVVVPTPSAVVLFVCGLGGGVRARRR
ncbi:MAG: hypothetical protein R3B68_05830 [Phycisphaerales bacterium]